ncbi:MAG: fibronectin type III domain-containing protein, partial [Spirochaetia bacterium]
MRQKQTVTKLGPFIAVMLLTFVVTACYNPLTDAVIKSVKDEIPPEIVISEPADDSNYSSTVLVSGEVTDVTATDGTVGQVGTLSWSVSPAFLVGGDVAIGADDKFSFSFLTTGFSGSFILSLEATDANGNVYETSLTLNQASSDIPSFSAVAGNEEITLSWEPVPMAASYTLYYTTDGGQPSEFYGNTIADVTSPYPLTGLENGSRHVFLLQSVSAASEKDYSEYVESIPLSTATLQPNLQEGSG